VILQTVILPKAMTGSSYPAPQENHTLAPNLLLAPKPLAFSRGNR
jgi:hypothetical protein